jgi:hypothetical protein
MTIKIPHRDPEQAEADRNYHGDTGLALRRMGRTRQEGPEGPRHRAHERRLDGGLEEAGTQVTATFR